MTAAEFKRIRLSLDPADFAQYRGPAERDGPGRPPSDEVTQKMLARFLAKSERQVQRYEEGSTEVPDLVEREMRRAAAGLDDVPRRRKRGD
jgi:hypothetical protein